MNTDLGKAHDQEAKHEVWTLELYLELEEKQLASEKALNEIANIAKRHHVKALAAERASLPESALKELEELVSEHGFDWHHEAIETIRKWKAGE